MDPSFKDWHIAKSDSIFNRFPWVEKEFVGKESGRSVLTKDRFANGANTVRDVGQDPVTDDEVDDKSSIGCSSPGRSDCGSPAVESKVENPEKSDQKVQEDSPKRAVSSAATLSSPESTASGSMVEVLSPFF